MCDIMKQNVYSADNKYALRHLMRSQFLLWLKRELPQYYEQYFKKISSSDCQVSLDQLSTPPSS